MGETEQANPVYIFYSLGKASGGKAPGGKALWGKAQWTGAGQSIGNSPESGLAAGAGIFSRQLESHSFFNNKASTKKSGINPESRQGAE
jgi:hypothetical protein